MNQEKPTLAMADEANRVYCEVLMRLPFSSGRRPMLAALGAIWPSIVEATQSHAAEAVQSQPSGDSLVADLHAAGFETFEPRDLGDDTRQTWTCRIGTRAGVHVPPGGDAPMRDAVQSAFMALTGECAEACFSGWGDKFTESELAVIENRAPNATRGSVGEARLHALEQALQDSVGKIFSAAALTAIYRHCDELLAAATSREAS